MNYLFDVKVYGVEIFIEVGIEFLKIFRWLLFIDKFFVWLCFF